MVVIQGMGQDWKSPSLPQRVYHRYPSVPQRTVAQRVYHPWWSQRTLSLQVVFQHQNENKEKLLIGNLVQGAQDSHLVPFFQQTRFKLGFLSPSKDPLSPQCPCPKPEERETFSPVGFMEVAEFSCFLVNLKRASLPGFITNILVQSFSNYTVHTILGVLSEHRL